MSNLMPDGNYRAIYRAYDTGMTRNGNEQIALLFEFTDGDYKGREETWYGTFTEASFPITYRTLVAMGWKGQELTTWPRDVKVGTVFNVYVKSETFEGKERNRISTVRPTGMLALADQLKPEQKKRLADRVRDMVSRGVQNEGKSLPRGQSGVEDDIPF